MSYCFALFTDHGSVRSGFSSGKKNPGAAWPSRGLVFGAWQFPTFAWQTATLSSALSGFTSEFGMGSGGSRSLWSPSKLVWWGLPPTAFGQLRSGSLPCPFAAPMEICTPFVLSLRHRQLRPDRLRLGSGLPAAHLALALVRLLSHTKPIGCYMVKPHGQLVHVSYTHCCASTPCLSTS